MNASLKKKILKQKWVIILFSICFIFVCAIIFYIVPTISVISEKKNKLASLLKTNELLFDKIKVLDSFELKDLEDKYVLANVGLFANRDPYRVISVFDDILSKTGEQKIVLGPLQFSVGDIAGKTNNKNENLLFIQRVNGSFEDVINFVNLIENGYPIMSVSSLRGRPNETLDSEITFTLYIVPDSLTIPSIETPIASFSPEEIKLFEKIKPYSSIFSLDNQKDYDIQNLKRSDPFN